MRVNFRNFQCVVHSVEKYYKTLTFFLEKLEFFPSNHRKFLTEAPLVLKMPIQFGKSLFFAQDFSTYSNRGGSTISQIISGPRAYFSIKRPLFVFILRATELTQ